MLRYWHRVWMTWGTRWASGTGIKGQSGHSGAQLGPHLGGEEVKRIKKLWGGVVDSVGVENWEGGKES